MPIDHIGLHVPVESFDSTVEFYKTVLTPLGYKEMMRPVNNVVGLGEKVPDFWIAAITEQKPPPVAPIHIAFSTMDRNVVDTFHATATSAGAKCNGPPGLRPHYHEHYYGAFVIDPSGNNLEVVCHCPEGGVDAKA